MINQNFHLSQDEHDDVSQGKRVKVEAICLMIVSLRLIKGFEKKNCLSCPIENPSNPFKSITDNHL